MQKHIQEIYNFATEKGYKVKDFKTAERTGRLTGQKYHYVTVSFEVPAKDLKEDLNESEV